MQPSTLYRLAAIAAILGGILRISAAFPFPLAGESWQILYFTTDLFLLPGLTGFYLRQSDGAARLGLIGYAIAFTGLLLVRSAAALFSGGNGYQTGAGIALFGTSLLAIALVRVRGAARIAPMLWLGAQVLALGSLAVPQLAAFAGIVFGVGFIAAGAALLRTPN